MNVPDKIESIINDMTKFQRDLDRGGCLRSLLDRRTTRNKDINKALDNIMKQISELLCQVYIDKPPTTLSPGNSGDDDPINSLNKDAIATPEDITAETVILCEVEVPGTDTSCVGGVSGMTECMDQLQEKLSNTTIEDKLLEPREQLETQLQESICSGDRKALYALCRADDITCIKIGQITGTPKQLMYDYSTRYNPQGYILLKYWGGWKYYMAETWVHDHPLLKPHRIRNKTTGRQTEWFNVDIELIEKVVNQIALMSDPQIQTT